MTKKTGSEVSIRQVARLAGVSPMTVSRVLSSPQLVAPETLLRVQAIIDSLGYVPNRVAGSLSSNRSSVVALIVPSLRNALYAETMQGMSDVLGREGFQLMISDSGYSLDEEERLIRACIAQRVCGLVLHNTTHTPQAVQMIKNSGIPCVETGNLCAEPVDMAVSYSNYAAGKAIAEHLADLGYKHIGFASLRVSLSDRLRERRRGFLAGLRARRLKVDAALSLEVGPGLQSGAQAVAQLLDSKLPLDAVFFAGDVLGAGALIECLRRGIAVPHQLAVAASDDNELMQNMLPALTTVRFPRYQIGVRSAELILDRALQRRAITSPVREDLGFEVIQRGST
jgi:LacI family gluconate utilization system Gnt-I transcriptional repressor